MVRYDTYLLRIWCRENDLRAQWVADLEQLEGGTRRRFGDPRALLAYLNAEIGETRPSVDSQESQPACAILAPPCPHPEVCEVRDRKTAGPPTRKPAHSTRYPLCSVSPQ